MRIKRLILKERFVFCLIPLICMQTVYTGYTRPIPIDGYAAMVNNRVITVAEVLSTMRPIQEKLKQLYNGSTLEEKMEEAYEKTLNSLIERELIMDYFDTQKELFLPDTAVNSRAEEIIKNRFKNDYTAFNRALDAEGLTFEEWKKQLRTSIVISLLREREIERKIAITPASIREFYHKNIKDYQVPLKVKVRAIMLKKGASQTETEAKRKEAENIRSKLLEGADFGELATKVSEGYKADAGGDWGWIEPNSRREEIAKVIENMAVNEISPIVETEDAFYILKVEDKKEAHTIPFDEVAEEIKNKLRKEMADQLYTEWIERLKKQALIQKF